MNIATRHGRRKNGTAPRLGVFGAGRAARTLAHLWHTAGVFEIGPLVNRSLESARQAAGFIGVGFAAGTDDLKRSDIVLLGLPDSALADGAAQLAAAGVAPAVAFHLSAGDNAEVLAPLRAGGTAIGAVHPALSFADPESAARDFTGTYCLLDGDDRARRILSSAFSAIGGELLDGRGIDRRLYHAAAILASNATVTIMAAAEALAAAAGLPAASARPLLAALAARAVEQGAERGPDAALSGPFERGDQAAITRLAAALPATPAGRSASALFVLLAEFAAQRRVGKSAV